MIPREKAWALPGRRIRKWFRNQAWFGWRDVRLEVQFGARHWSGLIHLQWKLGFFSMPSRINARVGFLLQN